MNVPSFAAVPHVVPLMYSQTTSQLCRATSMASSAMPKPRGKASLISVLRPMGSRVSPMLRVEGDHEVDMLTS